MPLNPQNLVLTLLLALSPVAALLLPPPPAHAQNVPHTTLPPGLWGGTHLEMQVTEHGATLEFDCAQGTISEPLALDSQGKFELHGTFQPGTMGPAIKGRTPPTTPALYTGKIDGNTMRLELKLADTSDPPQEFTLTQGQHGKLRKCY